MKRITNALLVLICSISLVGCDTMTNQDAGVLAGGLAGGLLGSTIGQGGGRTLAIMAGAVGGALLGSAIGKNMDDNDRLRMTSALESNNVGQPAYWHNANTNTAYEVIPTRNVEYHGNQYCREYKTVATIGGKQREMYGTACRQPDGSWKAVS